MAESTVRDLFRSLEQTLHERLRVIEDVLKMGRKDRGGSEETGGSSIQSLEERVAAMEAHNAGYMMGLLGEITQRLAVLEDHMDAAAASGKAPTNPLIPAHPMEGIEVVPKREVVLPMEADVGEISLPDRLLLNKRALKALEAKEMGEEPMEEHPSMNSEGGDTEEEENTVEGGAADQTTEDLENGTPEEAEEEAPEEEAAEDLGDGAPDEEEAAAEVELEEFEYKGSTYYRDTENLVYMVDEDGDLVQEPIGAWNEDKQKILKLKSTA